MTFKIIFGLTLILALVLRLWQLNNFPPSLNWDEVSLGYNAYSILHTGKDEWGKFLPVSFRAYGDYKLPAFVYLDVPFISIFGLNQWGVRIPSAFLGVGTVIFIFFFLKRVANIHVTSWGIFLASILPWSVTLSRIALEANMALFLTVAAIYFFIVSLEQRKWLYLSSILFGLTVFTYNSSRVVTPLLILVLSIIYWKNLKNFKKTSLISVLFFLVFFSVALPNALLADSSARYRWTAILDEGAINRINELRGSSALPPALAIVNYNKITYVAFEIAKNYFSHFDPNFLFLNGGSNYQFSVPGSGLLYPVLAPFLLLGVWRIFKEREKWQVFAALWLLIAPVPAAITRDAPHALRALMIIPPLIFITSLGLDYFIKISSKFKILVKASLMIVLLVSLSFFWENYSISYLKNYSWSWQYGYKEVVDYIQKNGNQYEKIYITKKYGEPHEFLLFYSKYNPQNYRNDPNLNRYFRSDWYWVDSFDKYVFVNDWEVVGKVKSAEARLPDGQGRGKSLLITSPGNYPQGSKFLETINFLDGKPAFDIVELIKVK